MICDFRHQVLKVHSSYIASCLPKKKNWSSSDLALLNLAFYDRNATCVNVLSSEGEKAIIHAQKYGCIIVGHKVSIVIHTVDDLHTRLCYFTLSASFLYLFSKHTLLRGPGVKGQNDLGYLNHNLVTSVAILLCV